MKIKRTKFGVLSTGEKVHLYTIKNADMSFSVTNFGCTITSIVVPSKNGVKEDIVLGYSDLTGYINSHGGLEVDANGNFARFEGVTIDGSGSYLDPRYYDAVSGSTKVTLKGEYLNTLSLTNHTLRIYFEDGYAETSFSIRAHLTPTTGDNSNLTLWIVLSGVSLAALAVVAVLVMKNNKHKKRPESSGNK